MATRLRDLLNIKTAESLEGAAGPVDGNQIVYQTTCYTNYEDNYHDNCCVAFLTPAGVSCVTFEVWGAGGSGTGLSTCCDENACYYGPGGGAGAYVVRCLNDVTNGDRFDMIIAQAGCCISTMDGRQGCWSCLCGPNAQLCAQGGGAGCVWCNWGEGVCCSSGSTAYGGDINIDGQCGKICICCNYIDGFNYNQHYVPFPGGLSNLCGGWVQVSNPECASGCRYCNYIVKCDVGEKIPGIGNPGTECFGYIPGLPSASFFQICECECCYPCQCADGGNPGMIRVTYK